MRHRLNRGGDRRGNCAFHRIARTRLQHDPATVAYVKRRRAEGKTDREIMRCIKRFIAREVFELLTNSYEVPNAANLKERRRALGLSLTAVKEAIGVTTSQLSAMERHVSFHGEAALRYEQFLNSRTAA